MTNLPFIQALQCTYSKYSICVKLITVAQTAGCVLGYYWRLF